MKKWAGKSSIIISRQWKVFSNTYIKIEISRNLNFLRIFLDQESSHVIITNSRLCFKALATFRTHGEHFLSIIIHIIIYIMWTHLISNSRISCDENVGLFVTSSNCRIFSSRCFFFLFSFPCSTLIKSHSFFNNTVSTE